VTTPQLRNYLGRTISKTARRRHLDAEVRVRCEGRACRIGGRQTGREVDFSLGRWGSRC
jgi:hypothetical protein